MKTNSSYMPLFFLCWAFLYTPLALLDGFSTEAKGRNAVDTGSLPKPELCRQVDFAPVNACGVKSFFCFDAALFVELLILHAAGKLSDAELSLAKAWVAARDVYNDFEKYVYKGGF